MKLRVMTIVAFVLLILFCTGCENIDRFRFDRQKAGILFNDRPITADTVMDYKNEFELGQRVYYLIVMPKMQESRMLFVQLIKKGKTDRLGYDLYWARDVRLNDEELYYFTDYVMVNQKGAYIMKVYSKDKPTKPLTMSEFYVY